MYNKTRIEKLRETEYQKLFEIRKPTFDKMLVILESAFILINGLTSEVICVNEAKGAVHDFVSYRYEG